MENVWERYEEVKVFHRMDDKCEVAGRRLKYFKPYEFVMGDVNVYHRMNKDFLYMLDDLREAVGFSIFINSSYRDEVYNESVGGVPGSKHLLGIAVDIHIEDGATRAKIVAEALRLGFNGIGIGKNFMHLDSRGGDAVMFVY